MTKIIPTIVAVDDSETAISLYRMSVENLGVKLETFLSADEAYAHLENNQPDLLILDIVMPEKDGITLLKDLRAMPIHHQTPVIVVTSKDYAQDRIVSKELDALEFLLKPLRPREIRELIKRYTGAEEVVDDGDASAAMSQSG